MVERWSSKPYAWVRFLLPLQHIVSRHFNSLQTNLPLKYFRLRKNNSWKFYKSHLPVASNLMRLNKNNPFKKVYFIKGRIKNCVSSAAGLNFLFKKKMFQYNTTQSLVSRKSFHFWSKVCTPLSYPYPDQTLKLLRKDLQLIILPNISRQLLQGIGKQQESYSNRTATNDPTRFLKKNRLLQPVQLYYRNLQHLTTQIKSTKFLKNTKLLRFLTNKYSKVRKLTTWRNVQTELFGYGVRKNQPLPTLTLTSSPSLSNFPPISTVVGFKTALAGKTSPNLKTSPYAKIFNLLFAQGLFSSNLLYKKFVSQNSPTTTKKLLRQFLRISSKGSTADNIILQKLGPTPKFFISFKDFQSTKFQTNFLVWYNFLLIRFLENVSGLKVSLLFNPYLHKSLSFYENAQLNLWTQRVKGFQRLIGPKVPLRESLTVTYLSLKLKDPTLLSNWMSRTIHKVSFWKYRALFRYLKFLFHNLFLPSFPSLSMRGVKLKLKGKVSVAGNARTRAIYYRIGNTSQSTFKNKVLYNLNFFYTFTGILGLQIWYYF